MTKNTFFRGLALILLAICALCPIKASAEINYSGLLGDVNKDKAIDISDVTCLIDFILTGNNLPAGIPDVNLDEAIDINDATKLIDMLLKGDNSLTFLANGVVFKMIHVEGGTFTMGSNASDAMADVEKPAHNVTLSSYYIAETEVTQIHWKKVMNANPSTYKGDNLPVHRMTWDKAQDFIAKLNELTGFTFRMPTDAEWEYAARGGKYTHHYRFAGSSNIDEVAVYSANSGNKPNEVATKAPNELGLYDMTGNVFEWVADWYAPYTSEAQTNPTGPETGRYRVERGGGFNSSDVVCRITNRMSLQPTNYALSLGMRLAITM